MPLRSEASVQEYAKLVFELRGGLEDLLEFVGTLPAPNDDFEVPSIRDFELEDLRILHKMVGDAGDLAAEFLY